MENENYLITSDNWFYAPDGKQYRSIWGKVSIMNDSFLGIKTNIRSSNWFAKIGSEENHVIIAGCQIHYAVRCEEKPNTDKVVQDYLHEGKHHESERLTHIYIAE